MKISRRQTEKNKQLQKQRLYDDFLSVISDLRDAGSSEAAIDQFIELIKRLPAVWLIRNRETLPKRKKRYQNLTKKIALLAKTFKNDPEWKWVQIDGHDSLFRVGLFRKEGRPLIHEWLEKLQDTIAAQSSQGLGLKRRRDLRTFVLMEIFSMLESFPIARNRNRRAEILASYVLNEEIPSGTLVQARKNYKP